MHWLGRRCEHGAEGDYKGEEHMRGFKHT
jgi:hypothetical protein